MIYTNKTAHKYYLAAKARDLCTHSTLGKDFSMLINLVLYLAFFLTFMIRVSQMMLLFL